MSKLPPKKNKLTKTDKCTPQGTGVGKLKNSEYDTLKINKLQGENDDTTVANQARNDSNLPTPRRKRTVKAAKKIISDASYPNWKRSYAYARIRKAKQPVREAKAIVARHRADRHKIEITRGRALDLSDVQELRVKLIRKDYGVWSPHIDYLKRMEIDILSGIMTANDFKCRSAVLMGMEQPLSDKFRKAEWLLSMTGEQKFPAVKESKHPLSKHMIRPNPKSWSSQPQHSQSSSVSNKPISVEENASLLGIPEFLKRTPDTTSEDQD